MRHVYGIGDSISMQYDPFLGRMLQGVFDYDRERDPQGEKVDLDRPRGANGGDSRMVLESLRERGSVVKDILLLNCGLHDVRRAFETEAYQVGIEDYRRNLGGILEWVKERGVTLLWVRTTPVDDEQHNISLRDKPGGFRRYNADVLEYNRAADEIMGRAGVPLIDLYTFTLNLGPGVYCDHVHFVEEVRAQQAAFIAGHLYPLAEKPA